VEYELPVQDRLLWWAYNGMLVLAWPWLTLGNLLRCVTGHNRWSTTRQRLGWQLPFLTSRSPRIWIHALSVGETHSVAPLVQVLREALPEWGLVFSTATETGQDTARRVLAGWVDDYFYMPHDFAWSMMAMIRRVRPQMVILVETDVWPNLVWSCYSNRIPCVLVNARISPRSFARLKKLRTLVRPAWNRLTVVFAQSKQDRERFLGIGLNRDQSLDVGNLKFDSRPKPLPEGDRERLRGELGISPERSVWVAGSTHDGEELILLQTHRRLLETFPDCLLIMAPRRIQRASMLAQLCRHLELTVARRSQGERAEDRQVYLLDTLGELAHSYALARVAFIGGSLTPFGGHNPLEALAQGVPMVWGPHLSNFRQVEDVLLASGCARRVDDEQQLFETVRLWLDDSTFQSRVAEGAEALFDNHAGSSQRILARILGLAPG
jgi:3-deoxy-D-manno-octulosonic-acid transferase